MPKQLRRSNETTKKLFGYPACSCLKRRMRAIAYANFAVFILFCFGPIGEPRREVHAPIAKTIEQAAGS